MKKNKKGFTLVELLAVIALLALLMGIAVSNIISTINNSKRNDFLADTKRMVAKAEYLISASKTDRDTVRKTNGAKIYRFADLNVKNEFPSDADGGSYNANSYVKVTLDSGSYKFCVCVLGSKRRVGGSGNTCNPTTASDCLDSKSLTGIDIVKDS